MKRVLIFSLAYYPHVGGAEVALKEITDRISDIEFHLITLRFSGRDARDERVGNVSVHRVGLGGTYLSKVLFVPLAAYGALRLHRAKPFDAFWAMMSYMTFPISLLRLAGVRVPYLLTLQEGDPFEHVFLRPHIAFFRPLLSYGFRHASAVQAISSFLAAWAKGAGFRGMPVVIPNGVDTAHFARSFVESEVAAARSALGKDPGAIFLVTTSRLVTKNAVDDVIAALPLLPERVQFVVYGVGPLESELRRQAEGLSLAQRVHFKGQLAHTDMPLALAACDLFIRPSRSEGMGNSFIEAMAAGLPVIATQEGGIADFLFDAARNPGKETTGWAVDKDSPEQIARAVQDVLAHPEERERVVSHARKLVREKYDWNLVARDMGALLVRVAGTR